MKKIAALAGLLLVVTAACGKQPESTDATTAPAADATTAPAPAAQNPTPAPTTDPEQIAAGEELGNEGEEKDTPITTRANVQLASAVAPSQPEPQSRWQAGKHYTILVPAQPTNVSPDKIEVVEVFWYGCPHCFALEPFIQAWEKKKPAYVQLTRIPVVWGPVHRAHAQLFYTLATFDDGAALHDAAFKELQSNPGGLAGNSAAETLRLQAAFAKRHGVSEQEFSNRFNSMGVRTRLSRAEDLTRRYRVEGVPVMVINGKYTADVTSAGGQNELIALISDLAAREQKKE